MNPRLRAPRPFSAVVFLGMVSSALLTTGCTVARIHDSGAVDPRTGAPLPKAEIKQFGGRMAYGSAASGPYVWSDNEKSFDDGAKTLRRIVSAVTAYATAAEWLDTRRGETAAAAATDQAQIAAATEGQRIAADQAIQSQTLDNQALEITTAATQP